ncbi:MAG: CAAX prenyl protease-related protein [Burkholderiales bacterium]|nr:CAAX prenyl protease-related protein [Burkholderiales bacterium]
MALPLSRGAIVRTAPFALFMIMLFARGNLPDNALPIDPRWIYGMTVLLVGGVMAWLWREYGELYRQNLPTLKETALAMVVGVAVFVVWINLDMKPFRIGMATATFIPLNEQGQLQWPLIIVRWIGAALLVPVMEELFWRSFLMRWIDRQQFETLRPQQVTMKAIVLSTFVFTLAHTLWLAAIIAGLAYAWLFVRTGKLWVPIIAHAVTNGVLGLWVVKTGNWGFW